MFFPWVIGGLLFDYFDAVYFLYFHQRRKPAVFVQCFVAGVLFKDRRRRLWELYNTPGHPYVFNIRIVWQ